MFNVLFNWSPVMTGFVPSLVFIWFPVFRLFLLKSDEQWDVKYSSLSMEYGSGYVITIDRL